MNVLQKLRDRIRKKGLRAVLKQLCRHYVYFHEQLVWMERDLVSPIRPNNLRPYTPLRREIINTRNTDAFATYFRDHAETMRELAAEGHTGIMYLDDKGDTVAFIWGSTRDYFDRHFFRCWFPIKPGEFFQFCGELYRAYWGTRLSVDLQLDLWKAMAEQGCNKAVAVFELSNVPAVKLHLRMDYQERGQITHMYQLFGRWRFFRDTFYTGSVLDSFRKPAKSVPSTAAA
ncbi:MULTISPECIES: N-acetyltransferase [Pseudomonas]|uniref:N-acetyltransferase n=1 Tax=Pseudomonas TaxID=286 RepID=UPI001BE79EFF|nr:MULTISPECIES: N-acetyltransferase [Pseudomonas]MBT2337643.1 N-acetyltransferase [Pseudomonas fluorescens]MCD4527952.1 N-acetyltransferase [Pseudomonas sp. C3-2018]